MLPHAARPWSKAPALRLLIPFMAGVGMQWYTPLPLRVIFAGGALLITMALLYPALPLFKKFSFAPVNGVILYALMGLIGAGAVYSRDVRNDRQWFGHYRSQGKALVVRLEEPLVEKPASWKAVARVESVLTASGIKPAKGKILLYFQKDSLPPALGYGARLVVSQRPEVIRNSGNPGAFDYRQYCLFQGITHQVYLAPRAYHVLPSGKQNRLMEALFRSRRAIIGVLQTNITGQKEQGLAEALLIGYKDDLDKRLLLSYANTGVVHVIAISGLHVGLIYWLLLAISRPLKRKSLLTLRLFFLLAGLWGFGLLAGAQASVMRSVVMFSFLAGAEVLHRRTSVYNTLALSALLLLCYNPFWLWDVGFQLSYAAVASILLFYRPVSRWLPFQNKALALFWKMNAVTLSAQVFTTPLVLYHFHQFPLLFLFTNLVAVPLSSVILLGEITLCGLAFFPSAAQLLGAVLSRLIGHMNTYIEGMDSVPFAVWRSISITAVQAILLTVGLALLCWGLMERKKAAVPGLAFCAALFLALRTYSFWRAEGQRELIVYNVPKHRAIDVLEGRRCRYIGDAVVERDPLLRNYNLQPSRVLHRAAPVEPTTPIHSFSWQGRQVVILDSTLRLKSQGEPRPVDLLILSGNAKVYLPTVVQQFPPRQVVVDASVPRWKARLWKRDCAALRIRYHDVQEKGAFVLSL